MKQPKKCPKCDSLLFRKDGKRGNSQRFLCKNSKCKHRFSAKIVGNSTYQYAKAYSMMLYLNGLTYRWIGELLGFDEQTISRWLKPHIKKIKPFRLDRKKLQGKAIKKNDMMIIITDKTKEVGGLLILNDGVTEMWGVRREK